MSPDVTTRVPQVVGERMEGVTDLVFGKSMIYSFWIDRSTVVSLLLSKRETISNIILSAFVISQSDSAPLKTIERTALNYLFTVNKKLFSLLCSD